LLVVSDKGKIFMTIECPTKQSTDSLKKRIKKLEKTKMELYYEMAERGEALERIKQMIDSWIELLPLDFYEELHKIVYDYVERCTSQAEMRDRKILPEKEE